MDCVPLKKKKYIYLFIKFINLSSFFLPDSNLPFGDCLIKIYFKSDFILKYVQMELKREVDIIHRQN